MARDQISPQAAAQYMVEMLNELSTMSIELNDFVLTGLLELSAMAVKAHLQSDQDDSEASGQCEQIGSSRH